jgi:hypothetical protein
MNNYSTVQIVKLRILKFLCCSYPQTTEPRILQGYISQETHQIEIAPRPLMAVTNAVSGRSEGIKYRRNEVHNEENSLKSSHSVKVPVIPID